MRILILIYTFPGYLLVVPTRAAPCGCLLLALRFGVCSVYCCSRLLERRRVAHQLLPVILACLEVSLGGVGGTC